MKALRVVIFSSLLGCGAPVTQRPPARIVPPVRFAPMPPQWGWGRAIIDVVDEHALVSQVVDRPTRLHREDSLSDSVLRPLCISPCAILLPWGRHRLGFTKPSDPRWGSDTGLIDVDDRTTIYRHQLRRPARAFGPTAQLGLVALIVGMLGSSLSGLALAAVDATHTYDGEEDRHLFEREHDEIVRSWATVLGLSVAASAFGVLAIPFGGEPAVEGVDVQWTAESTPAR